jgi:hypothetical protein
LVSDETALARSLFSFQGTKHDFSLAAAVRLVLGRPGGDFYKIPHSGLRTQVLFLEKILFKLFKISALKGRKNHAVQQ